MKFHITKDGKKTKLEDLETSHLENIIKLIERKSVEGFVRKSGGGSCAEDMWYEEETIFGSDVKRELNFYDYQNELNKRKTKTI